MKQIIIVALRLIGSLAKVKLPTFNCTIKKESFTTDHGIKLAGRFVCCKSHFETDEYFILIKVIFNEYFKLTRIQITVAKRLT